LLSAAREFQPCGDLSIPDGLRTSAYDVETPSLIIASSQTFAKSSYSQRFTERELSIVDLFVAIPASVWGVLVGSLITFIGVGRQLRHDARQRDRERQMQLKRDVYLEAAEGIAGSIEYYFALANADIPLIQLSQPKKQAWLNKVYTVASMDTIAAFTAASGQLGVSTFDLLKFRIAVEIVSTEVNGVNARIETVKSFQQQLRNDIATMAAQPPSEHIARQIELINTHWQQSHQDLAVLQQELMPLLNAKGKRQQELLEKAIDHFLQYQKYLRKSLIALRVELELPVDERHFEQIMDSQDARITAKLKETLAAIGNPES
jgi:hypothetical protein